MDKGKIYKQCAELPYSRCTELSDDVFRSSLSILEDLWNEHGYASVLGVLSKLWPLEKAIPFMEKIDFPTPNGNVKTIATCYRRAYNGGIERVQAQLMNLWVEMGYRVILFTEAPENELDYPYPSAVKRIILPSRETMPERLDALQKYCEEEKIDLYIYHIWWDLSAIWECVMLKKMHIPFIEYIHGHFAYNIWKSKNSLFQPDVFRICDLVLSLSETNARFYQLCGCNSYVVNNPIPEDLINNRDLANLSSKHILMIGRLSFEKRPMDGLKIFKMAHDRFPNIILDVVGGDDENFIPQMQEYIRENSLEENVVFHGKRMQSEVAGFYKESCCVLFTSEMEGYPMVVLESKAYGLPLIMYDMPYLSLIKDGKGILIAPVGEIEMMADNLVRLLGDDCLREQVGREARESFDSFAAYDYEGTWNNIISLCVHDGKEDFFNDPAYLNPKCVMPSEKMIMPMLLDGMKKGFDGVLRNSIDYIVGNFVLKFPRKIQSILKKSKESCHRWKIK